MAGKYRSLHFQGKQLCNFHCYLPYKLGLSHKGKNLLLLEQILSFMSKPLLGRLCLPGKHTGNHKKMSPFENKAKKGGGVPIHLKTLFSVS